MKKLIVSGLLLALACSISYGQNYSERTGYEGDYFSLEGALDLFKESSSLRNFERKLNTRQNWVNNLDLNYDGRTDYIRVEHRRQGNFHAIILQALVDRYDIQDVAVIELEIIRRGDAVLQIIGDEDLYGEEVIVEPVEGYSDSRRGYHSDYGDYVNVYYWRPVQYILDRQYRVYASPYRWRYYPSWWSPWVQVSWNVFRPRVVVYVNRYHVVRRHRVIRVHNFYRPYRTYCTTVVQRANRVRVRHGRAPIHRPAPPRNRDRRDIGYQGRNRVSERPNTTSRRSTPKRSEALSRNRTVPSARPDVGRSRNQRTEQGSRSSVNRSQNQRSTIRSGTPRRSPNVSRNGSTSSDRQKIDRSRNQRTEQRSRSSVKRTEKQRSTIRTTTPKRNSGVNRSRSAPSGRKEVKKSSAPRVKQSPSRSRTSSPQKSSVRKPSVSSKRSTPTAKPKTSRSSSSKRSSSRSRKGGGDL